MFTLHELGEAVGIVRDAIPPTPAYRWPLLAERAGLEVWVKHENHTPTGAFKVRGGLVYMARRRAAGGVIGATRGNHGQSLAFAGRGAGVPVAIVVPHGNSAEKNRAMRALGAELIEHGHDFDAARAEAGRLAAERRLEMVPSFHPHLVQGVATYALELFQTVRDLDAVYVPIGLGSGVCGLIRTRDLLGLRTEIVGVVTKGAPAYARSMEAGRVVGSGQARTFADGCAVRVPDPEAFAVIQKGAARVVEVDDDAVADAIRAFHEDTHNTAEGAGAVGLAGLLQERDRLRGRRAATILCGGNIDRPVLAKVLAGETPAPF
ncbi:MAG: threonine dehydratase [Geminicoccaceae bacterium]|nr:threonine dehydratase [Geminicoccaceae bacterium]